MGFDWSPYFGGYSIDSLLGVAATGAGALLPLLMFRLSIRVAGAAMRLIESALR